MRAEKNPLNLIRVMPAKGQDMLPSLFIARLIGPVFAVIGIGMLTNNAAYRVIGELFLGNYAIIYVSGILVLTAGLTILNLHNEWTRDWRSVITAIGWIFCIAGVWRIIAPQLVPFVGAAILTSSGFFTGAGIVLLALGSFIAFKGYTTESPATQSETAQ